MANRDEISDGKVSSADAGFPDTRFGKTAALIALVFASFHLYTSFFGILPGLGQRIVHLGFVLVLVYFIYPALKRGEGRSVQTAFDFAVIGLVLVITVYGIAEHEAVMTGRAGLTTTAGTIFGVILLIVLLEGGRRVMGPAMPIIALAFIGYAMVGPYLPGALQHRGYNLERIVQQLFLSYEGVFGLPLGVAANFIVLFVILGAFLQESGAGKLFLDIAYRFLGRVRGGPAKMSVVSSALFGTVSGSAVANVVVDGWLTIPMMKKAGLRAHIAGAVEAVASTGGQLMPPVMGAAAFVIADILGISYFQVCVAAALPAVLYYVSLFFMVDFEAAKMGLWGLSAKEMPDPGNVKQRIHLLIPIGALVFFLGVLDWSPLKSAGWAVVATVIVSWFRRSSRMGLGKIGNALKIGGKGTIEVSLACAMAGIIVGVFSLTGLGVELSTMLIDLSGGNLLVLLTLTMVASLILGMGLPTVACYIILAVLVAPALIKMGVAPMAAHLYIFYFGVISNITPPVALAAYAGAGIAGSDPMRTGFSACRLGLAGFIIPYMFVYGPAMVMIGPPGEVMLAAISGIAGVMALAAGLQGYLLGPMNWIQRGILLVAALLLIKPGLMTDLVGYGLLLATIISQLILGRRRKPQPGWLLVKKHYDDPCRS